jgi:hypothetical protein
MPTPPNNTHPSDRLLYSPSIRHIIRHIFWSKGRRHCFANNECGRALGKHRKIGTNSQGKRATAMVGSVPFAFGKCLFELSNFPREKEEREERKKKIVQYTLQVKNCFWD